MRTADRLAPHVVIFFTISLFTLPESTISATCKVFFIGDAQAVDEPRRYLKVLRSLPDHRPAPVNDHGLMPTYFRESDVLANSFFRTPLPLPPAVLDDEDGAANLLNKEGLPAASVSSRSRKHPVLRKFTGYTCSGPLCRRIRPAFPDVCPGNIYLLTFQVGAVNDISSRSFSITV